MSKEENSVEEAEVVSTEALEKEYRFAQLNEKTEEYEEVVYKESELTKEHHEAMFYDMWEYFENASTTAQQLFLLKLQMENAAKKSAETTEEEG